MTRGKRTYRTVVADSHNLFRRGLSTLIEAEADMEVIGEALNAEQAIALAHPATNGEEKPTAAADVLVLEIGLLDEKPDAVRALRQLPESVAVLLLASQESSECMEVTVATGARGYMLKTTPAAKLIAGIRQATSADDRDASGLSKQAPDLHALAETERTYSRTSPLTAREQEVMTLLAEGRTVREVASELSLSIKTIEAHKLNLMRKLDIHNRASLVDYAVRNGLATVQPAASGA